MAKNYSAIKFKVAEDLGDWMGIIIPIFFPEENRFEYKFLHHQDHDGISMMTKLMTGRGLEVLSQPTLKETQVPGRRHRMQLLSQFIQLTKKGNLKWKHKIAKTGRPDCFAHIYLDRTGTKDLEKLAKDKEVTLTTWMLYHLDLVISKNLLDESSDRKWVLPLNMRTQATPLQSGNHSASIILNIKNKSTPQEMHQQMRNFLKAQLQWGSSLYSNMAGLIGYRGTRWVAKKIKDVGTGVFSNLGHWPVGLNQEISASLKNEAWGVVAPASQVLPVAAAMIIWDGQISLTLQFHPSLEVSPQLTETLASQWIQSALRENYQFRPFELNLIHYENLSIPET
ncbi:MAG: hypothetical protein COW00_02555 [Bdellovibrio sp. CG12_big_fil_rev_8_21_14_0_65_39_13]|nr:MAG: hypothetical protein COW78_03560 [Bdellovibrio sp. CG22_combo_CG10-13_8_21_14_all_39_27]PIQ62019.1 MAG: hypothetical protein COW00_02555 [Bdellovibrio sp. CG12_big_fil_rev_8_21_14_0_65_39_13]PIR34113.1 MAG: hypothetical protein COV37_14290 [Bdellovibrio sp. CG11_big_fil_rev_8_21_14_0_20_39_38]PJB52996.1 MAG: hypothetical protein CO099_09565 [Bdellovibrio sp. CG_4_9_14_3_um_filter_39_7]